MPSPRANKPVTVTLGPLAERAQERVRRGDYASLSEVVRAGLRALDREEALIDRILPSIDEDENDPEWQARVRRRIEESLADARPPIPIEEAWARLDQHIADYKANRAKRAA